MTNLNTLADYQAYMAANYPNAVLNMATGVWEDNTITNDIVITGVPDPLISTWETTVSNETVIIPLISVNGTIDWGDGTIETINTDNPSHIYNNIGQHTVSFCGSLGSFDFISSTANPSQIKSIDSWGSTGITKANFFLTGLTSMNPDLPDTLVDLSNMFRLATSVPDLSNLDTSNVEDFSFMFWRTTNANPDTTNWDLSSAINITAMFNEAAIANPNTTNWNVSNVTSMAAAFLDAPLANPDVSNWNVSSTTTTSNMFLRALSANPDVSNWDMSSVTDISGMFAGTLVSNPDVSNWDTSNVTNMTSVFAGTQLANPDVSLWDTSNVTTMSNMFHDTVVSNPDVSNWNTSNVTNMFSMFEGALIANPDVSSWDTSSVTTMYFMFSDAISANPDISNWNLISIPDRAPQTPGAMNSMFLGATSFTTLNYDAALINFNSFNINNILFSASSNYTLGGAAEAARNGLLAKGWGITDLGGI